MSRSELSGAAISNAFESRRQAGSECDVSVPSRLAGRGPLRGMRPSSLAHNYIGNNATCTRRLTSIFHGGYSLSMAWEVEYTDEFGQWWATLSADEQVEINAKVLLLQERGPVLPRPHSDVIVTSKHSNMKELRGSVGEAELRVLYAFDPKRSAILLIGGDKNGNKKWYDEFVPIADRLFDQHLAELEKEKEAERGKKV